MSQAVSTSAHQFPHYHHKKSPIFLAMIILFHRFVFNYTKNIRTMKKLIYSIIMMILFLGCSKSDTTNDPVTETPGTIKDIDGNVYTSVKIGTQTWMKENLKVTHYRNGDAIPNIADATEWVHLNTGAFCFYNNDLTNKSIYGSLYNGIAVMDGRYLAPKGWHVSSDTEWTTLIAYLGGEDIAGNKLREVGISHWVSPNQSATNESGFTALPGGYRDGQIQMIGQGEFSGLGEVGYLWTSTKASDTRNWYRAIFAGPLTSKDNCPKQTGFPVRCIKD